MSRHTTVRHYESVMRSPYLNHVTHPWPQGNRALDDLSVMSNLKRRFGDAIQLK